jgi:hypothetical protein
MVHVRKTAARRSLNGRLDSPAHLLIIAPPAAGAHAPRRSTVVIAQALRYWLLTAWAILLAVSCAPAPALA